jgi:hypothetical protein
MNQGTRGDRRAPGLLRDRPIDQARGYRASVKAKGFISVCVHRRVSRRATRQSPDSVTRRVCDARRGAGAAIGVHHTTDSELGVYFVQGREDAGLIQAAPILSGETNAEARFLEVTMALQNVADLEEALPGPSGRDARRDEHDVTVLCHFRPLDPVPFRS